MDTRLALIPDDNDTSRGAVKPVITKGEDIIYGLSVGHWTANVPDGYIHIILSEDIDTIKHETATRKGVRAELRAAEKVAKGEEKKRTITLDPKTKRFRYLE